jgi:hypothetical protein
MRKSKMTTQQLAAALGVAPHSGWAAVVALGSAPTGPRVLARTRIELIEERFPESKQPYHAVEALAVEEAAQRLDRYRAQAEGMAHSALQHVGEDLAAYGFRLKSAGILESSGRKGSPLRSILASHSLIHMADGDHFRNALAAAAQRIGLVVCRVPVRDLDAQAEALLHRPLIHLQDVVSKMGRQVGPPWGADQKKAALLALLLLER